MGEELLCYNRGCGKTFVQPQDGSDPQGECKYHPGAPFFHDAYKGWTCCNRKATDFTEFLNFPGCTVGKHSRVKPVEPENITGNLNKVEDDEQEEEKPATRAPIAASRLARPPVDAPATTLKPNIAQSLLSALEKNPLKRAEESAKGSSGDAAAAIPVGEPCKNGGCRKTFTGDPSVDSSSSSSCRFHPGVPIFHEGMKFWSCCQRRTSDFQSFLNQEGCETGEHKWTKEASDGGESDSVACRYDWHQTATAVTVAVYCKRYDPHASRVELSPVRLRARLVFPEQSAGAAFDLDLELAGVARVEESRASMFGTKVEVVIRKAEPGSWAKLGKDITAERTAAATSDTKKAEKEAKVAAAEEAEVDVLDLDDLELSGNAKMQVLSPEASGGRTADIVAGAEKPS